MPTGVAVPIEAIVTLRRRLASLPARHPERKPLMSSTAELYGVSVPRSTGCCVVNGAQGTRIDLLIGTLPVLYSVISRFGFGAGKKAAAGSWPGAVDDEAICS
jgi:hypothetical protein